MSEWKVGQSVWYVPSEKYMGDPRDVTIESVGRKWALLAGRAGRFDVATRQVDGGEFSPRGFVYRSQVEYAAHRSPDRLWEAVRLAIDARISQLEAESHAQPVTTEDGT